MADSKTTALTELTTVDDADILHIVEDPAGTPVDKKITRANLFSGYATDAEVTAAIAAHAGLADPHAGYRLESASIGTTDIANDAVTFAKMQHIATDVLVGRDTAGTGDIETVTAYQAALWTAASSFPGSPATNQRCFRTDLGVEFFYNGTRWLSTQILNSQIAQSDSNQPFSATTLNNPRGVLFPPSGFSDLWIEKILTAFRIQGGGSALSASHKWVCQFFKEPAGTSMGTLTIDSGASGAWRSNEITVDALWGSTDFAIETDNTKTGTPGTLYILSSIRYRLVAT